MPKRQITADRPVAGPPFTELRRLRLERNLTQPALGARVGATAQWISQLESGARNPRLPVIAHLADALEVPVADLLLPRVAELLDRPVADLLRGSRLFPPCGGSASADKARA